MIAAEVCSLGVRTMADTSSSPWDNEAGQPAGREVAVNGGR